jgi:hypothetical protein
LLFQLSDARRSLVECINLGDATMGGDGDDADGQSKDRFPCPEPMDHDAGATCRRQWREPKTSTLDLYGTANIGIQSDESRPRAAFIGSEASEPMR